MYPLHFNLAFKKGGDLIYMNPDDPNQNPANPAQPSDQGAPAAEPTPAGEPQPAAPTVTPPAEGAAPSAACVKCGGAASNGSCVTCGQNEQACTCAPTGAAGGSGAAPAPGM